MQYKIVEPKNIQMRNHLGELKVDSITLLLLGDEFNRHEALINL